jgi:hypothetical protein
MENKPTPPSDSLLEKLTQADICCHDCGQKFGVYSVECSTSWEAECPVCEKVGRCTETRDYGYLTKGINELKAWRPAQPFSELTKGFPPERKARIKEQSKILAEHLATLDPIMNDDELENTLSETKYRSSITQISVHREDSGHRTLETEVRLVDEGCGEFISLTDTDGNEIRLDFEEFEEVIKAVTLLKNQ